MAQSPHSALWWSAHSSIIKLLHDCTAASSREKAQASLEAQLEWLQHGVCSFARPSTACAQLIIEARPVPLRGKKYAIVASLKSETLKLSKLLDLNEFQTHILLRRWLKESGNEALLLEGVTAGGEVLLPLHCLQQVLSYYHEERLQLIKCLQFVLLQGTHDEYFAGFAKRVAAGGHLEACLITALRTNLDALNPTHGGLGAAPAVGPSTGGAGRGGASGSGSASVAVPPTVAARMAAVTHEYGAAGNTAWLMAVHQALREHALQERCELLAALVLLYRCAGAVALPGPARVLEIVTLVGKAMWPAASGAGRDGGDGGGGGDGSAPHHRVEAAAIAEYLASLLVLAAINPPAYVEVARRGGDGDGLEERPLWAAAPESLLPLGGKMKEVHSQIRGWAPTPGNAVVLLTWSAMVRLAEPLVQMGGDTGVDDLQGAAFRAGGFDAILAMLEGQERAVNGACAQVYRHVLAQSVALMAMAFDLGAAQLNATLYESLLRLVKRLVAGNALVCAAVWSAEDELFLALRSLLNDAASLFPALLGPYLQLLTALAEGPAAALHAYEHLQTACPTLVCLHDVSDPLLHWEDDGVVTPAVRPTYWNRAPNVAGMCLPEAVFGRALPLPTALSHLEGRQQLISWDVCGTKTSFGQLLLLGRAAQCLISLQQVGGSNRTLAAAGLLLEVQDLRDTLHLLAVLVSHRPDKVPDLMALSVDVDVGGGTTAARTWLDVAAAAAAGLGELPASAEASAAVGHALQLLAAIAQFHPTRVIATLQGLPLLAVQMDETVLPSFPLHSLPDLSVNGNAVLSGLMPALRSFQSTTEAPHGKYPATAAFLQLLATLLQQGFSGGPMPVYVMCCLHELLPAHRQWRYQGSADRWALTASLLRVVRLAVEAGLHVQDVARQDGGASGRDGATDAGPAGMRVAGLAPDLHISALAAHVLQQLLLHGHSLLYGALPPHAEALESLRSSGAPSAEVEGAEAVAVELLRLLPLVATAAKGYPQPLPLEEWLLQGLPGAGVGPDSRGSWTPAGILTSYVAYGTPEDLMAGGGDQEGGAAAVGSLPCLALRALHSVALSMARPAYTSGGNTAAAAAVALLPRHGAAEQTLRASFHPDTSSCQASLLAAAADVLVAATIDYPGMLDTLLFPCGLTLPPPAGQAAGVPPSPLSAAGATVPPAVLGVTVAAAGASGSGTAVAGPAGRGGAPGERSMLDGLWAQLQLSAQLRVEAPEVLAHVLRCVVALWQSQHLSHGAIRLLRDQAGFWTALLGALPPRHGGSDGGGAAAPLPADREDEDGEFSDGGGAASASAAWRTYCEACVWQLLAIEAYASKRQPGVRAPSVDLWLAVDALLLPAPRGGAGTSAPSTSAAAADPPPSPLLVALRRYARPALQPAPLVRLAARLQALHLELGVSALGGILLPPQALAAGADAREDLIAVGALLKQELAPLLALMQSGAVGQSDVEEAHLGLLEMCAGEEEEAGGDWTGGAPPRLVMELLQRPLGRTLLAHSRPADALLQGVPPCGVRFALASDRLLQLLGPVAIDAQAVHEVADAMDEVSLQASLADTRLTALQSAGALLCVLLADYKLRPALLGAVASPPRSPGPSSAPPPAPPAALSAAIDCASTSVMAMLRWGGAGGGGASAPTAAAAAWSLLQPQYGLFSTVQGHVMAAQASCRLMVQVLHAAGSPSRPSPPPALARALASVTPQQDRQRGTIPPSVCVAVVALVAGWLRVAVQEDVTAHCGAAEVTTITDVLCGAALLALQLVPPTLSPMDASYAPSASPAVSGESSLLQVALLDALPRLCCAAQGAAAGEEGAASTPAAAAVQVVMEIVRRHLPPPDWLPVLRAHLDLLAMLRLAARRTPEYVAPGAPKADQGVAAMGDLGLLQLALAVAQVPDGARMLHEQGALVQLASLARYLLSPNGGMLVDYADAPAARPALAGRSAPPSLTNPYAAQLYVGGPAAVAKSAAASGAAIDLGGCYYPGGAPSPVHQQWCVLLSFAAALLRTLAQHVDVETRAVELLAAAEERMHLSCQPPAHADARQPLTAAGLHELQRTLFLLSCLSRYAGTWHLLLPGSLARFRTAVSRFIAFAALPSLEKVFVPSCQPQSAAEKAQLTVASGMPKTAGWFRACSLGSRETDLAPQPSAAPAAGSALPAAGGATPTPLRVNPRTPGAGGTPSLFIPTPLNDGGDGSAPVTVGCSEYSARLAESLFTCTHYALLFLIATSPQVAEGEASSLGPAWPKVRELSSLQETCLRTANSMAEAGQNDGASSAPGVDERRNRVIRLMLETARLTGDFLDLMGSRRRDSRTVRETMAALERYLAGDRSTAGNLGTTFSVSWSPSRSSSVSVSEG